MIVEPGEVGFRKVFGNLSYRTYQAGFHIINPFSDRLRENVRRQQIDYVDADVAKGLTRNKVELLVDVSVPWIISPPTAPRLYERYGKSGARQLVVASSRNAIRQCTAAQEWEDAVSETGRTEMARGIPAQRWKMGQNDLQEAGCSASEAERAFTFPPALVRKIIPEKQRILAAISEEQAAIVDLRRQETLTAIAKEEANRRANEGAGVRHMMAELPTNFTVAEMVAIIEANAAKANAEAFAKAVEAGNPHITVITGGGDAPVPVTARAN